MTDELEETRATLTDQMNQQRVAAERTLEQVRNQLKDQMERLLSKAVYLSLIHI